MCAGVGFSIDLIDEKELENFFAPEKIKEFQETGTAISHYWDPRPVLPMWNDGIVTLCSWGNRDRNNKLPVTGWARDESIMAGKWNYLSPEEVKIPVLRALEKGVWFDAYSAIKGIIVSKDGDLKLYMVTKDSCPSYLKFTGHDREPCWIA